MNNSCRKYLVLIQAVFAALMAPAYALTPEEAAIRIQRAYRTYKLEQKSDSKSEIPSGIVLPSFKNDEDKLKFLVYLKKKIPNLFSDAATYDINLLDILDDQKK